MGKYAKRALSWVLALSLLMTCAISGLVLPTAADDGNLIVNGDFEQGASVAWGGSAYVMDGVGVGGSKGYKIESTVNEGDSAKTLGAYYMEAFNGILEPYTTYVVSFDYKTEGKGWGRFQVLRTGSDWTGWTAKNNLTAADWTTYSFEFTTGAAENMNANKGWEWKLERIHYANASNYGTGAVYYDNIKVVKKPAAATAITLNKTAATVKVGATTTLTATAAPDGAAVPAITWKSSNEAVATVANGVVTGVAAGTATITATAEGLAPVTCEVTVEQDSNLFANGDFEGFAETTPVVAPWSTVSGSGSQMNIGAVTAGVGVDGSYGLKLGTATGSIYVAFPSKVALEEGATYRLSWMAKSGTVSKAAVVMLNSAPNTTVVNASSKSVYTKLSPTAGEWISYYMDFKASAGAYIHDNGGILIDVKAVDSSIVFDNFALTKIDEDVDLILDGDFEKGSDASLYAETLGGSYTILSNANKAELATAATTDNANNRALKLKGGAAWTGGYFIGSHFVGGESYKVSFDYKGGEFRFYANPASHGSFGDNAANVVTCAAAEDWTKKEFVFNFLTSGSNNWAFSFEKKVANIEDSFVDNLKIVKIVEEAPAATGIALDKTEATIDVDATVTLTPSVLPEGAEMPAITWKSSDETVATVANGVVTGVAAGTATITATAAGLAPVTCTVTVNAPVPDSDLLKNGDFEQGAAVAWGNSAYVQQGVGKDGSWGIKIATEVLEGQTAVYPGVYYKESFNGALKPNTTYIFSYDYKHEGKGFGQLNVYRKPSDWTGWANSANLTADDWTTVTVEFTTGAAENMNDTNIGWEWQIRHVHYANAANYGQGALYVDNFKLEEKVVIPATSITLSPDKAKLEVGAEATLNVTVLPEDAEKPEITWSSSNTDVVKVENGKITAVAVGTATITATAGALTDTCEVTVIADDGNMIENGDLELGAAVAWGNSNFVVNGAGKDGGYGLKIETSVAEGGASVWPGPYYKGEFNTLLKPNTKYVFSFDYKVEGKGFSRLNVLKKGSDWTGWSTVANLTKTEWTTVTIEFTTGAEANMVSDTGWEWIPEHVQYSATPGTGVGYFDNFKLEEKVVVPATGITLDKTTADLKPTQSTKLVVTAQPENAEPPVLEWKSSNDAVATVDATGKVTAVAVGTATITVTANGTLTATCTVTVKADDGNMIVNGDFVNGTDAWGRDQTQKDRIEADAGKEGAGVKLETNITETTTAHQTPGVYYLEPTIALLEPDTIYTFSFDYKHEGMGFGQIVFNISPGKLESGAELKNIALASGTVDWKTMTYTFSTPSAMPNANTGWEWQVRQVQYYDKGQGSGTTWFDNFKLVKVGKVVHADSIAIAPETLELFPNDSGTLAVTTSPIGASTGIVTWTSSDPTIVEVDQKGNVKALKAEGEVTITATNDKGKSATAKVVITEYASVIINGDFEQGGTAWGNIANVKPGIGKDGGYGLQLTHEGESGWSSYYYKGSFVGKMQPATTYILTLDYYAPSVTTSIRTWSYDLGVSISAGSFKAGKDEWQTVTKIFTTPTDMKLNAGWDFSLVCETTGDPAAVIDNISIKKYSSGKEAESIVLNLDKMTLIPGRTGALTAHATPVDADLNDMIWTSSDENVATVEYGVVTGVGKGTAVITGTTKNGKSATCTVTVSGNEVLVLNGSFDTEDDVWTLDGGATIADGEGRVDSDAAALIKDAVVKQTFKGLKADTQYQLFVRYRTVSGKAAIKLQNGETVLVEEETGTNSLWSNLVFDFKTGETVEEDTVLTFTGLGNGPIYIDNVIVAVKASLIDFTVSDIIWVGGGHQVTPGTELTFAVTVTNIGVDPVLKDQVIVVDLCKNGEVFQTLEYVCDAAVNTNDSIIVMASAPWAAVKGDWVVSARANPTLSILELDDTNNTKQVNLRVNETILEAPKEAADMDMTELTFSDEFDSYDSIDMYATGKDGYKWYVTRSWGAGTVQPDSYTVKDGIISLHDQKPVFNITMGTVDAVSGVGWDYQYGYLETRLRIVYPERHEYAEGMSGGIPAIWSFPTDKWLERPGKNRQWVEMDWLEYWGKDTQRWPQYPDGYYTITLHDQKQNDAGEQESWKVNGNSYQNGLGDGEWHVMGWLWAYNGVIAYIDGEEVFRITYSADGVPSCKVRTSAGDMFNDIGAFSYMNEQELCLYIAGAYDKPLELDYVRIWQGGNAEVEMPDEGGDDEEGEVIVDIEAEDFWNNFCTDDYGDPITEIDENNYQYILMGAEYWNLLSDERKAEINEVLKAAGQPTFEELVEAVEEFLNENPDAMAQVFIDAFLTDEEGNLITEATTDNYLQILAGAEIFMELDKDVQLAIIALMGDYGMPSYEELVEQALAIAEDEGLEVPPELDDFEIPETGATSAWPMVATLLILVSAAALWISRKRKATN